MSSYVPAFLSPSFASLFFFGSVHDFKFRLTFHISELTCAAQNTSNAIFQTTAAGSTASGFCISGYAGIPTLQCLLTGSWSTIIQNTCARESFLLSFFLFFFPAPHFLLLSFLVFNRNLFPKLPKLFELWKSDRFQLLLVLFWWWSG